MSTKRLAILVAGSAVAAGAIAGLTAAPAKADDTYAAIAYSPQTGLYATISNASPKDEAVNAATDMCHQGGATDCVPVVFVGNGCVALAVNPGARQFAGGSGATIADAEANAVANSHGGEIQGSKCSTG
jgi:Domain of unknown function (DUF4189)